ncbi:MAG: exodeoxyribonuclease VII large subunit [Pseudomonadales bacterium]|nr:exodeoxyribonuclease VII large subunit [Pseudomonadales bacterium]
MRAPTRIEPAQDQDILSVSSLNQLARSLLEGHFPNVVVEGEISNLAIPASGHWYLTLKDDNAQVRCAMFRNRNLSVRFRPSNGIQVIVRGRLSIYEGRGDYQLILEGMEEAGAGALQRAFEQLKARLAKAGLFDPELKQPMPGCVRHVGVITSASGAAIRDILSVFARRFPAITITILPVPVQGAEAPAAIVAALQTANRRAKELGLDVLILSRGGGSLEDLQAFNEESVAQAIFASKLPVVSAVGHEVDFTIADFVADLRAPTPSAAAELLSPDQQEYWQWFSGYEQTLLGVITQILQTRHQTLKALARHLKHPGRKLQDHAQTLDRLESRLHQATLRFLQQQATRLHALGRSLDSVSPLQTLHRGYSITRDQTGQVLRHNKNLSPGQLITTQLESGKILSKITELEP